MASSKQEQRALFGTEEQALPEEIREDLFCQGVVGDIIEQWVEFGTEEQALPEDIREELFCKGVVGDIIEQWVEFGEDPEDMKADAASEPQGRRREALQYIYALTQLCSIGFEGWCECVLMFDLVQPSLPDFEELLLTCDAVVRIVGKTAIANADWSFMATQWRSNLARNCLRRAGLDLGQTEASAAPGSMESLNAKELDVLLALDASVCFRPSAHTWLSTMVVRMMVMTRGLLCPTLEWISRCSRHGLQLLLTSIPSSVLPPRRAANGLLFLGLVWGGVLPMDALVDDDVQCGKAEDCVRQQYAGACCCYGYGVSQDMQKSMRVHMTGFLKLLQVASRTDLATLREHAAEVARSLEASEGSWKDRSDRLLVSGAVRHVGPSRPEMQLTGLRFRH